MAWNVPDDWGMYYRKCEVCGGRYHESGSDVCDCVFCVECGDRVTKTNEDYCDTCLDIKEEEKNRDINDTIFQFLGPFRISAYYKILTVVVEQHSIYFKIKGN